MAFLGKRYEDYGIVLDFLPEGHPEDRKPPRFQEPVMQLLGEDYLTLLEAAAKEGTNVSPHDRVYLGKEGREKVDRVKRRIDYNKLTSAAKAELPVAIERVIDENNEKFLEFFNNASPVTSRYHQLELIPGIGKKLMWATIEEREKKDFESFEDLKERVKSFPDPKEVLAKRIEKELRGEDKYSLFVRKPKGEGRGGRSSR